MEEKEYLRNGDTLVTSSRIEIGGQTFAVRNVGSVKVNTPGTPWAAIVVGIIGLPMLAGPDTRPVGFIIVAVAAAWAWSKMRQRSLVLVSGGGETVALKSSDGKAVETLRGAIAEAISGR